MKANFYNMIFWEDNVIPFIRQGMPITMADNVACINGLGKYRVFKKPELIEDDDIIEEVFKDYSSFSPWYGKESDGIMYLYRAEIDEDSLNLIECTKNYKYLHVECQEDERVSVLNGKVFFRRFENGKQSALVRFEECTVMRIEKQEGLIMLELVDGEFICR